MRQSNAQLQDAYDSAKGKAKDVGSEIKGQAKVGPLSLCLCYLRMQCVCCTAMFGDEILK